MFFTLASLLSLLTVPTPSNAPATMGGRYRISALECLQDENWVLVSQFNNGDVLMSWGTGETASQVDLATQALLARTPQIFSGLPDGKEVRLEYTPDETKHHHGRAAFVVKQVGSQSKLVNWHDLVCQKFIED